MATLTEIGKTGNEIDAIVAARAGVPSNSWVSAAERDGGCRE